jgi:hypothetical protein
MIDKIGIELECGIPERKLLELETYCNDEGFQFKRDSSIRGLDEEIKGREIATNPFIITDIPQIKKTFNVIYKDYIGQVNYSTGMHIHLSFTEQGDYNALFSRRFLTYFRKSLRDKYKDNEPLMKRMDGSIFKENHTRNWAKSRYRKEYFMKTSFNDRYKMVNFASIRRHNTVEFRIFDTPQKSEKVIEYLAFLINRVEEFLRTYEYPINMDIPVNEVNIEPNQIEVNEKVEAGKIEVTIGGIQNV